MYDFLSFDTFITPSVLLVCYYMGAVVMPLVAAFLVFKLARMFPALVGMGKQAKAAIPRKYRLRIYIATPIVFLCMEIVWRMMFEAMIAYFQMREALVGMAG